MGHIVVILIKYCCMHCHTQPFEHNSNTLSIPLWLPVILLEWPEITSISCMVLLLGQTAYLHDLISWHRPVHALHSKHQNLWNIPRIHCVIVAFPVACTNLWMAFHCVLVKRSPSQESFKHNLAMFYLTLSSQFSSHNHIQHKFVTLNLTNSMI